MGEQVKRRLLMDGQYGNISFICTQTDDCEATEIMRDHQEVAATLPGRWERMTALLDGIGDVERELLELQQAEDDLRMAHEEALALVEDIKLAVEEANDKEVDDTDGDVFVDADEEVSDNKMIDEGGDALSKGGTRRAELLDEGQQKVSEASRELHLWIEANQPRRARLTRRGHKLHRELKSICAAVRNEYSTKCLKEDFINGLKELYLNEDSEPRDGTA